MPHDVFLSYARADRHLALPLKLALEALGLDVFLDTEDIPPGAKFPERVKVALRECCAVLACWTPTSLASDWCQWECAIAKASGKLVPVARAPALTLEDLGPDFFKVNYAHCHDYDGQPDHREWARALEELAVRLEACQRPDRADTTRKVAALRGGRAAPAPTGLPGYRRAAAEELERTPWALQAPAPDAAKKTSELVVEVRVGVATPGAPSRSLAKVHRDAPGGRFMLLGDPGAGKTMILKHHGLWCLEHDLTPIFLRASELADTLADTLRANPACAPVVDELLGLLRAGRAALLVDSVDEVDRPDEKATVRKRLAGFAADPAFAASPIFAASRTVGYIDIPKFETLHVQPLSEDGMAELLKRWEVPAERIAELRRERREGGRLRSMSENPLLVTLMALALKRDPTSRQGWSRTGLYREAIDGLLAARGYRHGALAVQALGAHALAAHGTEQRDVFTAADFARTAGPWAERARDVSPDGTEDGFLAVLAQRTGLIDARGDGRFRFPHRTFAEYLAGKELARRIAAGDGAADLERVVKAASWDEAAEQRAWQPYFDKLARLGVRGASGMNVRQFPSESLKESWANDPRAFEFTLRPEHEATTAEVIALTHGVLTAGGHAAEAARFLEVVLARDLAPHLVARIGRALDVLDRPTAHRLLDAIPGAGHFEQRRGVLLDLPQRLASPAEVLRFVEERAARVTHGADLYWLHRVGVWLGEGAWGEDIRGRAAAWADTFWGSHRPEARQAVLAALVWVPVPAGTFRMGSPEGEGHPSERPQHAVEVTTPFEVLDAPVTNPLYERFDPGHAADREPRWTERPDEHPVYNVTWYEAMAFAQWLDAGSPAGQAVRLPFEVEWEYVARRGFETAGPGRPLAELAWFTDNSGGRVHPVRERPKALAEPSSPGFWARLFGGSAPAAPPQVCDLLGNVWEWCADEWDPERYAHQAARPPFRHDPATARVEHPAAGVDPSGARRVSRGGCWGSPASGVRVAVRSGDVPGFRGQVLGLRLVLVPRPPSRDPRP